MWLPCSSFPSTLFCDTLILGQFSRAERTIKQNLTSLCMVGQQPWSRPDPLTSKNPSSSRFWPVVHRPDILCFSPVSSPSWLPLPSSASFWPSPLTPIITSVSVTKWRRATQACQGQDPDPKRGNKETKRNTPAPVRLPAPSKNKNLTSLLTQGWRWSGEYKMELGGQQNVST